MKVEELQSSLDDKAQEQTLQPQVKQKKLVYGGKDKMRKGKWKNEDDGYWTEKRLIKQKGTL